MQYLLSQREMDEFNQRPTHEDVAVRVQALRVLRIKLLLAVGFNCIHDTPKLNMCCDYCPCVGNPDHKLQNHICPLEKEWGQA